MGVTRASSIEHVEVGECSHTLTAAFWLLSWLLSHSLAGTFPAAKMIPHPLLLLNPMLPCQTYNHSYKALTLVGPLAGAVCVSPAPPSFTVQGL